jgi:hypothetical protein
MAAETPFGLSFGNYGDPRRYIGQGQAPGKKIEKFIEKNKDNPVLGALGISLSGLLGDPASKQTPAPSLGQGISVPVAPPIGLNPGLANRSGKGIAPGSFQMPELFKKPNLTLPQIGTATPTQGADADGDGQVDSFWGIKSTTAPQPAIGLQSSNVDVTNKTDFNPLAPDESNQVALSGNDYQKIPGFGSSQEKAGKLMKIMGMG